MELLIKKNVNDCRESPIFKFIHILKKKKHFISYHDNYIKTLPKTREYNYNLTSTEITKMNLKKFDATILITDHDYLNFEQIQKYSKILFDCRGRFIRSEFENIV